MINERISREEKIKFYDPKIWMIKDVRTAEELIKINKWMYYIEKGTNRQGKEIDVYCFEITNDYDFTNIVKEIQCRLYGAN